MRVSGVLFVHEGVEGSRNSKRDLDMKKDSIEKAYKRWKDMRAEAFE